MLGDMPEEKFTEYLKFHFVHKVLKDSDIM